MRAIEQWDRAFAAQTGIDLQLGGYLGERRHEAPWLSDGTYDLVDLDGRVVLCTDNLVHDWETYNVRSDDTYTIGDMRCVRCGRRRCLFV